MSAQPQSQSQSQPQTLEEVRTLWIGGLQSWNDEPYLHSCFADTQELVSVKVIRNKFTGHPEGYGFIEFTSHKAAEHVLQTRKGILMPGTTQRFRLNWAYKRTGERRTPYAHSILVENLAPDVTDILLQESFRGHYSSVSAAKVVTDPTTGHSKGYGFVYFADETHRNNAITQMDGQLFLSLPMRIRHPHTAAEQVLQAYNGTPIPGTSKPFRLNSASFGIGEGRSDAGPEHSVFVSGLTPAVSDSLLQTIFGTRYPSVKGATVLTDPTTGRAKGCGFVTFADEMERERAVTEMNGQYCLSSPMGVRAATPKKTLAANVPPAQLVQPQLLENVPNTWASAEEATQKLKGTVIGQHVSWGNSPTAKQDGTWGQQVDSSQWSAFNGYGGQAYDAYAYGAVAPVQDPSGYAYSTYDGDAQYHRQDGTWSQQVDASQWSAFYGYGGQGYDTYAHGAVTPVQDPSAYANSSYAAGDAQYPQQLEGMQVMAGAVGVAPGTYGTNAASLVVVFYNCWSTHVVNNSLTSNAIQALWRSNGHPRQGNKYQETMNLQSTSNNISTRRTNWKLHS